MLLPVYDKVEMASGKLEEDMVKHPPPVLSVMSLSLVRLSLRSGELILQHHVPKLSMIAPCTVPKRRDLSLRIILPGERHPKISS